MLTKLDDSLWHQLPLTFDHVGTGDSRFFDRYWFAIYQPEQGISLQVTMGSYNNMNVLDAGVMVLDGNRQHNLRTTRALRPSFDTRVGPLEVRIEEPMERIRLLCAPGQHRFEFDLVWTAVLPPEEERPHFSRMNGRIQEDYQRFNQIGQVSGRLAIDGREIEVDSWWSARDHSWGIRPGIGGPQPVNGEPAPRQTAGTLFAFLFFSTSGVAGHVQIAERGGSRAYLTGLIRVKAPDGDWTEREVDDAQLRLTFVEETRRPSQATIEVVLEDGSTSRLVLDAVGPSFAMIGLGYGGWNDRLGLGVYRGAVYEERDTWDVSHAADVGLENGESERPPHRIQPVRVKVAMNGHEEVGWGSFTLVANGTLPKYGLQ